MDNSADENNLNGFGRGFYNWGFKRKGSFKDRDIIAVHPAFQEDPTAQGMLGTDALRRSKDSFCKQLTFSLIVYEGKHPQWGCSTLDIECETEDSYYLLLRGFRLIQEEAEQQRIVSMKKRKQNEELVLCSGDDRSQQQQLQQQHLEIEEELSFLWNSSGGAFRGFLRDNFLNPYNRVNRVLQQQQKDLTLDLFAPSNSIDPVRVLRAAGGGMLPVNSKSNATPPTKTTRTPPPATAGAAAAAAETYGAKYLKKVLNNSFRKGETADVLGNGAAGGQLAQHRRAGVTRPHVPSYRGISSSSSAALASHYDAYGDTAAAEGDDSGATLLPVAQFLGWNTAGTQIWARLKMAGLDVKCVLSWDLKSVILKIRCPNWRLEQMAEQMHLKVKSRDGHLKQFKVSRRDTFVTMGPGGTIFRSSERQQIIDYILRSKIRDGGAELDESSELGKKVAQRFPLHMYAKLTDIRISWITFWKRSIPLRLGADPKREKKLLNDMNTARLAPYTVNSSFKFFYENLLTQPLDSIAEYFGETIAFYFAFMAFYTRWLVFPSVLGFIVFCVQLSQRRLDHWLCPIYSIVIMVWACFMLAFWRQKASTLAFRWGVLDYEVSSLCSINAYNAAFVKIIQCSILNLSSLLFHQVEETERPQFRGSTTYDESTGELRKSYSLWKRMGKYVLSIPVILASVLFTLVVMTVVFYSQDQLYDSYMAGEELNYNPAFPSFTRSDGSSSEGSADDGYLDAGVGGGVNATMAGGNGGGGGGDGDEEPWSRQISVAELGNSEFWAVTFFYPCLYGILVNLLAVTFEFIAVWLNDFENHRTQTAYTNRLILKVFSFQFVTVFTSLYYYAFFMSDQEGGYRDCYSLLPQLLLFLYFT